MSPPTIANFNNLKKGFTVIELLAAAAIVAILIAVVTSATYRHINNANMAKCINQLRQLGAAAATYAGDHNNEWAFYNDYDWPADEQAWLTRRIRNGATWTALGKTFPYHQEKNLFYCPSDQSSTRNALKNADWRVKGSGSIEGTYNTRGYGQVNPRPLGKTYASLGRRALAACQFSYAPSNPNKLVISFHEGAYPVMFSDGSVQSIRFPEGAVNQKNPPDIWGSNTRQIRIWEYFDGKTSTLKL